MNPDFARNNHSPYDFLEPLNLGVAAEGDPLLSDLVNSKALQRLKFIRFLGGIDYLLIRSPNGAKKNIRYTRYQHSLGVASLALLYAEVKELNFAERRLAYVAALLHDVGHAPLSHSLEPVFQEVFGLSHHVATAKVVTGKVPIGKEVYHILSRHGVNIDRIMEIISGEDSGWSGFFSGPINFDTIEGIIRAREYAKLNTSALSPRSVTKAAIWRSGERDRGIVDEFWSYKDQVYRLLINSELGVLADCTCQYFMRNNINAIYESDYFVSEKEIFKKLPGLLKILRSKSFKKEAAKVFNHPISYTVRHFHINKDSDFFNWQDKKRYQQFKRQCILTVSHSDMDEPVELTQDLFNDGSN